ncbi:MAG TPA: S53 family serine peptidase [Gemmatimonadales bacterium]|nr:S53 family serine peptidase [Gemmatimonadales bacterium]
MSRPPRVAISHSIPRHPEGAAPRGRPAEGERRTVTIVLKAAEPDEELARRIHAIETRLPLSRPSHPTHEELTAAHLPAAEHFEAVERFARDHGLEVTRRSRAQHHVEVSGAASQLEAAFGVELEHFHHPGGVYQSHRGPVHLPAELGEIVQAVIGLDDAPLGKPLRTPAVAPPPPKARAYSPRALARRYRFPTGVDGTGQRIAIVAFGGGYHQDDLDTYFTEVLRLARPPKVMAISVPDQHGAGPGNDPFPMKRLASFIGDMNDARVSMEAITKEQGCAICMARALATFEVTMDIEIVGALAPGAEIDVYFANNTLWGWRAAIHAVAGVRDDTDPAPVRSDGRTPEAATVLSFSWGCAEAQASGNWKDQIDLALQKVRQRGVTVCCASGDLGSLGVEPGGGTGYEDAANVSCPASSPSVLACGGTTIRARDETAWNNPHWKSAPMATGGGVSGYFPRPTWQAGCNVPRHRAVDRSWLREDADPAIWVGRGVPDVAANADAASGYELYVGGRRALGGGTSAAAPLWAGLIALLNQKLSDIGERPIRLGFVNVLLYRRDVASALREIQRGNNRRAISSSRANTSPVRRWYRSDQSW